ncbi:MAG: acylphosphatase [Candidatus Bilamarchaeaceae archaeon]
MKSRVHISIYGDVQGVFFRAGTVSVATELGLVGWVRNRTDGSVEVVAEGEKKALEQLIEWCKHGPTGATVENVKVEWKAPSGEFKSFTTRPTE